MKWKSLFILASLVGLLLVTVPVSAVDWNVNPGESIQAAIDAAANGDTIYVHAGTYAECLTVDGVDLKLVAIGDVIVDPSGACGGHGDVVQVYNATVIVDGFTVNAADSMGGLYARGMSSYAEGPVDATFSNNAVYGFKKNGITVNGELAVGKVFGNTIDGSGPVGPGSWAQNGIQFGYGASGQAKDNAVTGHWYTGDDWSATGILVFEASKVTVQGNTVRNNETAVGIETWCWVVASASNNRVVGNTIENAAWGVSVNAWDLPWSYCDAAADNNKVIGNTILDEDDDGAAGVSLYAGGGGGGFSPTADNNKVINNRASGFEYDFYDWGTGTATKVHATKPLEP